MAKLKKQPGGNPIAIKTHHDTGEFYHLTLMVKTAP